MSGLIENHPEKVGSVAAWQNILNGCGYVPPLLITGYMDEETIATTKRFQKNLKLPETGSVTLDTWKAGLEHDNEPGWSSETPAIEPKNQVSDYAKKLAAIAESEFNAFHLEDETDPTLSRRIKQYWTDLGFSFPGVGTAWSAVFVSWCVKTAGATANEFKFDPAHSVFVHTAIKNAVSKTGFFQAFEIDSYAPRVGDIIQNNRGGNTFDFAFAKANSSYKSHSAIVIETGTDSKGNYLLTVGGNESDSVGKKLIRLTPGGLLKQPGINPFICVIKTMK
jgi:hypothetical protein